MNECKCGEEGQELHTCPYAEDVDNNSELLCNCCEKCIEICLDDI